MTTSSSHTVGIKRLPQDWYVEEQHSIVLSGAGEHAWFFIEKCGHNTEDLARLAADHFGVARKEVGYAGRKDKHGVTRQWFSVGTPRDDWPELDGVRCLEVQRHQKKLRIGQLDSNLFVLTLRGSEALLPQLIEPLKQGFANRFGPQRLSADNFEQACSWLLARRKRRISQNKRAWHLSVLRSKLFNAVLDHRSSRVALPRLVEGDVLLDGFASGPLWGRGRSAVTHQAAELEEAALGPFTEVCEALEYAGVQQGRRALYARPYNLTVEPLAADVLRLSFALPAGVYATSMLAELPLTVVDESQPQGALRG